MSMINSGERLRTFNKSRIFLFFFIVLPFVFCKGQSLSPEYISYIEQYKQVAVNQEILHRIPACITLAQGLLESGAGKSELAVNANNHFGIKCHKEWQGATYTHDDETKNECFRKYDKAEESYEDHSAFLKRSRYEPLFSLDIRDYKGWARTLKACGYATDAGYASKLIKIIEDYDLVAITETAHYTAESKQVQENRERAEEQARETDKEKANKDNKAKSGDKGKNKNRNGNGKTHQPNIVDEVFATNQGTVDPEAERLAKAKKKKTGQVGSVDLYIGHEVHKQGFGKYIVAQAGDTYKGIAAEFNIELSRILRYNGVNEYQYPKQGEKVWLNRKKK